MTAGEAARALARLDAGWRPTVEGVATLSVWNGHREFPGRRFVRLAAVERYLAQLERRREADQDRQAHALARALESRP